MPQRTGTHDIGSLLAATTQSAADFGVDTIAEVLAADNANYSAQVRQAISEIADVTTDRQRVAGSSQDGIMVEADEYSRIPTQKVLPGAPLGFPLRKFQYAIGWTRDWERKRTPRDFAVSQQGAQSAHLRRLRFELQKAIFTPTNSTFTDATVDNMALAVKALANADSFAIPNGPNGETYDASTHTHYLGSATLTAAAVQGAVNTVVEHGFASSLRVYINQADEAAFRLLTGFTAYIDPRISLNTAANQATTRLDITRMDNRAIGIFGAAEVWVKPWIPANYLAVFDVGASAKPLVMRVDTADVGFHTEAEIETFPLRAQYMEDRFGFGAWNRTNGAVLRFNNATYAAPSFSY